MYVDGMALCGFLAAPKPFAIGLKPAGVAQKGLCVVLSAFLMAKQGVFGALKVCEFGLRSPGFVLS
jgi:hypothetical protein